ncbi:MAG: retropepsin-like aspartic protease family protein, partial [Beijerinckiaceae bacterium]
MSMMKLAIGAVLFAGVAAGAAATFTPKPPAPAPVAAKAAAPANAFARAPEERVARVFADRRGHYMADIQINGVFIKGMIDTGATMIAIPHEEAAKIGRRPRPEDRTATFNTANGTVTGHIVRLMEVRLQGITVHDVEAAIMPPGALSGTLIGMSFMKK